MAPSRLGWVQGVVAGQTAAEVAQLGDACVARRQYRHAIDAYRHASSLIPLGTQANGMYAADIHVGVGNAFLGWAELAASEGGSAEQVSQMQEQAAREFSEAVAINQRHYPAQYNLGTLLYSLGEVEAAESHLLSAVTWNHQFVEARVNLAVVYAEQGEGAAAKAELRQALKFSPKHVAAHVNMALLLLGRVIVEEDPSTTCRVALGHLRRAAELSPQSGEIQHCLAAALLHVALRHDATDNRHRGGHVLVAPPVLEKAALVGGPRERFVRTVAAEVGTEVTSRRELLAEALVHYRRAAIVQESSQHSSRPSPFASECDRCGSRFLSFGVANRGGGGRLARLTGGDDARTGVLAVEGLFTAASHLAHSIKLETWMRDPRSATRRASVQVGLGAVQAALGRTTLAEGRYQEALRICPDHPDALFGLACVASGRTRLRHLRSLLRVEPTHPHAARMLGQCRRLVLVGADDLGLPERANRFDTYVTVWWNGEKLGSTRTKRRTVSLKRLLDVAVVAVYQRMPAILTPTAPQ
jgi:tetratricopeptide (TPR) repeat protein